MNSFISYYLIRHSLEKESTLNMMTYFTALEISQATIILIWILAFTLIKACVIESLYQCALNWKQDIYELEGMGVLNASMSLHPGSVIWWLSRSQIKWEFAWIHPSLSSRGHLGESPTYRGILRHPDIFSVNLSFTLSLIKSSEHSQAQL